MNEFIKKVTPWFVVIVTGLMAAMQEFGDQQNAKRIDELEEEVKSLKKEKKEE